MNKKLIHKLLKLTMNHKKLTLIFHHPKPEHWRAIQEAVYSTGFKLINKEPIQLRSKSLTHSQINTNKQVQGFIALIFEKSSTPDKLITANTGEYTKMIESLVIDSKDKGYVSKSEIYDYVITKIFSKYYIQDFNL